jgi:hypothetical protein
VIIPVITVFFCAHTAIGSTIRSDNNILGIVCFLRFVKVQNPMAIGFRKEDFQSD